MDVDAVEQQAGDTLLVLGVHSGKAGSGIKWVTMITRGEEGQRNIQAGRKICIN